MLIQGANVLCEPDLVGAPIVGCELTDITIAKPCTTVLTTLPGSYDPNILVAGRPAYLATLSGTTDGVPAGVTTAASAFGQALVQA